LGSIWVRMEEIDIMRRRNGLERPYHPLQLLGWGYSLLAVGCNVVLVRGVLSTVEQVIPT